MARTVLPADRDACGAPRPDIEAPSPPRPNPPKSSPDGVPGVETAVAASVRGASWPDHDALTVCDRILLAAFAVSPAAPFVVETLVIRAWEMFPSRFSLRTPETPWAYPHSVTVLCKMGRLVASGLLCPRQDSVYVLTESGAAYAQRLGGWVQAGFVGAKPTPSAAARAA